MTRDSQPITTTHRHILWAAGAGAALLAGAFLLGVQAGKQSVALRRPLPADSAEPLQELPENLIDQLQTFEAAPPSDKPIQLPPAPTAPAPQAANPAKPADAAPKDADQWTLQLVSTPDAAEARKVAAAAKAAGFPAAIQKEKNTYKVRLTKHGDRAAMDATAVKLKKVGIKSFAVKN
ncbi:MAG: SPOR domain-containing protein [Acidobacteria bacterium]|nr:SPOR domain-containing protein [Acidobacteriota bacterium]